MAAAEVLFVAEGIRAVGVERLLSESGVGRASFYRHFASKDALVVAMLRRYDQRWRAWLEGVVTAHDGDPLAIFDALAEEFESPRFRGCASINAMVETADPDSVAYETAVEHKHSVIAYLRSVLADAGWRNCTELAEQFMLLIDGATVTALRDRSPVPAQRAKAIANGLLTERPETKEADVR